MSVATSAHQLFKNYDWKRKRLKHLAGAFQNAFVLHQKEFKSVFMGKNQGIWNKIMLLKANSLPLMYFSVKNRKRLQYAGRAQGKQDGPVLCYISVLLTYQQAFFALLLQDNI